MTFRTEIRAWLEREAPRTLRGRPLGGPFDGILGGTKGTPPADDEQRWLKVAAARGLTAPTWPTEYGGAGLSEVEADVFEEELRRLELPKPLVGVGLVMVGPILLRFGTEEQKREHLPKICRGEIRWCQGYSEPGSGSDLASLSTRAVRDGSDFVVNGQKIWTSFAHVSDWMFCLVRTNPHVKKQAGITFLLIDMASPGVTWKPIELISGASPFCEVFFDDVRVPVRNVVHEIDHGWTVAKALLGHERSSMGANIGSQAQESIDRLIRLARRYHEVGEDGVSDPLLRDAIAEHWITEQCFRYTVERIGESDSPGHESSILKIVGSEVKQRRWELAVRIAGPQSLGWDGPGFSDEEIDVTRKWLRSRANSIEGGTSEIQLNIIAKQVLGLPNG